METKAIEDDTAAQEWMHYISPQGTTKRTYIHCLTKYCQYREMSPTGLIVEAEGDQTLKPRLRKSRRYLMEYKSYMESRGMSSNTVLKNVAALKSFYATFDIVISTGKMKKPVPILENTQIPTKEELQIAIGKADPLEKAVILVGCSSGLSMNEIINLKVRQFKEGYDETTGISLLKIRRAKTQTDHFTFLTPEASQAVWEYLESRNVYSDKMKDTHRIKQHKQRVRSDDGYLFIKSRIEESYLLDEDDEARKFIPNAYTALFRDFSRRIGMESAGNWNLIRSHNLRKVFYSTLINAGCDSLIVEYWMGHKIPNTTLAYFRASPDKLKDMYVKYVPALTITPDFDVTSSEEYQKMEAENALLAAERGRVTLTAEMAVRESVKATERTKLLEDELESMKRRLAAFEDMEMMAKYAKEILRKKGLAD